MDRAIIKALGFVLLSYVYLALATPGYEAWSNNRNFANKMQTTFYHNDFDEDLKECCTARQGMYKVKSINSDKHKDRAWRWDCRNVVSSGPVIGCDTSDYVNEFDLPFNFMCPVNQNINGVESYHKDKHGDCRWKFTCCGIENRITASCHHTGYLNDFDKEIDFEASGGEVITGVYSYNSDKHS
jgi:hypothetical protein